MKNSPQIFIGFIFISLGLTLLLNQLGILSMFGLGMDEIFRSAFILFLMYIGITLLLKDKIVGATIFLTLGIAFLIQLVFNENIFFIFWPMILIIVGVSMLGSKKSPSKFANAISGITDEDNINENVTLWESNKKFTSQNFKGGNISCVLGGVDIDLSEIKLTENITIDINCVLGGVKIQFPKNCIIKSSGYPVMGGWDNKYMQQSEGDSHTINVTGNVILGGVELVN